MVGSDEFPFEFRPIFRYETVSFREGTWNHLTSGDITCAVFLGGR